MDQIIKYPRTPHLVGSRLQPGDTAEGQTHWLDLNGGELVWEEKLDGSNSAISFNSAGKLLIQSRGHFLNGGPREAQFAPLKSWAAAHQNDFYDILGDRYIMYGEWCYAKHSVFYDALSHYFNEFDIYDKANKTWLGTDQRRELIEYLPVVSVPVVFRGQLTKNKRPESLFAQSAYKTLNWRLRLIHQAVLHGINPEAVKKETDDSDIVEGLYIKHEVDGRVIGRYKFVRASFAQTITNSGTHWADRPILPNMLA